MEESTHIVFDGDKIILSPDITPIFQFLMDIEKEIESVLSFNQKLDELRESFSDLFDLILFLGNVLKEKNIDFKYTLKEHPNKIAEKLQFHFALRSQMIVLFASLEVLFSLHMAYELQTSDAQKLRVATMDSDNTKKFINAYILTDKNQYYLKNKSRLSKIDSRKFRDLRNSLTHFFSVGKGGLSIAPEALSGRSREFENDLKRIKFGHIVFLSEQDLYGLIKDANILRVKTWSEDFKEDKVAFKSRIKSVIDLVNAEGAVLVRELPTVKATGK